MTHFGGWNHKRRSTASMGHHKTGLELARSGPHDGLAGSW